jgi:hypothetical protein
MKGSTQVSTLGNARAEPYRNKDKKNMQRPGIVHTCNPSTQEVETGDSEFEVTLGYLGQILSQQHVKTPIPKSNSV